MRQNTQNARILRQLQAGKRLNARRALEWCACMRLAARIYDLRQQGHPIESRMVSYAGGRYAEYVLRVGPWK